MRPSQPALPIQYIGCVYMARFPSLWQSVLPWHLRFVFVVQFKVNIGKYIPVYCTECVASKPHIGLQFLIAHHKRAAFTPKVTCVFVMWVHKKIGFHPKKKIQIGPHSLQCEHRLSLQLSECEVIVYLFISLLPTSVTCGRHQSVQCAVCLVDHFTFVNAKK